MASAARKADGRRGGARERASSDAGESSGLFSVRHAAHPAARKYAHAVADAEFLVGGRLTLADLAVASPFANMRHMKVALDRWPRTLAYVERILARPSFAPLVAREAAFLERSAA